MRMALTVIIEPPGDQPEHCSSIQQWVDASIVAATPVEWLSDNGSPFTARVTLDFAATLA
jgi:hypothetical protein